MQENGRFLFNLADKVKDYLKQNPEQKYSAREIAEWILKTYPEECEEKKNRSKATSIPINNDSALISQIVSEIPAHKADLQKKYPQIKWTGRTSEALLLYRIYRQ